MSSFLLFLLLLIYYPSTSHPHRNLFLNYPVNSIIDITGVCHDVFLNSSSTDILGEIDTTNLAAAYGIVFSIKNTAYEFDGSGFDGGDLEISALSIYMDGTEGANYSVYVLEGEYFSAEEDGTVFSMLGGALEDDDGEYTDDGNNVGWKLMTSGTIEDFAMNFEGMSVLLLEKRIVLSPSSVKSIYVKLSSVSLIVEEAFDDGTPFVGENVDSLATVTESFDHVQIRVGRGILLKNWASGLPAEIFDTFYPPRRFLGNLYFAAPACTITVRNSYFELYGIGETVSFRNSYRIASPLFSHDRDGSRLLQEGTTSGCLEPDRIYPIIEGKLKEIALKKYSELLPVSIDVTDVGFYVKADNTIWSSAGDCKNIRIIFDEKLVYSMTDTDEMTVEELAMLPFSTLEIRQELLMSLSESDVYFSRFGQVGELIVTDPALPTRMPSWKPSAMPSLSVAPSMEPSDILSETPSLKASTYPSDSPTTSSSNLPSSTPSVVPTENPSPLPRIESTEGIISIVVTTVEFKYDIWYPVDRFDKADIQGFIIGNVTDAFRDTLFRESPLLPLVHLFDLDLSDEVTPSVTLDAVASDVVCITDDLPENANNICERFSLRLSFKHLSTMDNTTARFWILRVADRSVGNLKCNYSGLKSIASNQVITFKDASGLPTPEEEEVFCDVIASLLNDTVAVKNYTVTNVSCVNFEFIPNVSYRKRLRLFQLGLGPWRRLQAVGGDLNMYYNISSEYTSPIGEEDTMGDAFGDLIEDSINRGAVGDDILKSLENRKVEVVENAKIVAREVETPAPTPSPTYEDMEPNAKPSAFENSGNVKIVRTPNSLKTSVILVSVFSVIVLCSTFSMYFYYLRRLRILAKEDFSYKRPGIADNAFLADIDDDRFNENRLDWNPMTSMRSLTLSALGDEPDLIHDFYDERVRRTSLDMAKDDDINTNSSTISDVNTRKDNEGKFFVSEAMNPFRAFENRADRLKSIQCNDAEEPLGDRMKSKQSKHSDSLGSSDERILKKQQSKNDERVSNDTKLMSSTRQKIGSKSSFEDRLKSKMSIDDIRENKLKGNDHKSTISDGSFDERLKSKLLQDDAHSDSGTNYQELSSEHPLYGRNISLYSIEDRLRAKFSRDDSKAPSGDWHQIVTSVKSMNQHTQSKFDYSPGIPSDISFSQLRKSFSRDGSIDSFDKRIQKKLSTDSVHTSGAMNQSLTSIDTFDERIRRKFESNAALPSRLSFAKDDNSSHENSPDGGEILSKEVVDALPIRRHSRVASLDSMNSRIQRKLVEFNHDDSSVRSRDKFRKSASVNTFEARIQQELVQQNAETSFADTPKKISPTDWNDKQMLRKLHEPNRGSPSHLPIAKHDESSVDSKDSSTFEQRIQQKLAQKLGQVISINRDQSATQLKSMDQRLQRKLESSYDNLSLESVKYGKSASRDSSVDSFDARTKEKLSQHVTQVLSGNDAKKMTDSVEQKIYQRLSRSDTRAPSDRRIQGIPSIESMDIKKITMDGRKKYTNNSPMDSYDLRLMKKLQESSLKLSQCSATEQMESSLSSDGRRLEDCPSKDSQSFAFGKKTERKMSSGVFAQSQAVNSFEAKLQKKLSKHDAKLGTMTNINNSFKITLERKLAQSRLAGKKHASESSVEISSASAKYRLDDLDKHIRRKLEISSSTGEQDNIQLKMSKKRQSEAD